VHLNALNRKAAYFNESEYLRDRFFSFFIPKTREKERERIKWHPISEIANV